MSSRSSVSPTGLATLSRPITTKSSSATNAAVRRTDTLARHTGIALTNPPSSSALSSSSSTPSFSTTSKKHEHHQQHETTVPSSTSSTTTTTINTPPSSTDDSRSFIDRVKAYGVQAMLGKLVTSSRFDRVLQDLIVTSIDITEGTVECELLINEDIQNTYGTLHGGAIATIVDVVGTMAILTKDPLRAGVSVDLNVTYLAAAKANEKIRIIGKVLKSGKRLAFSEVSLYRSTDNSLLATGRHTKAL